METISLHNIEVVFFDRGNVTHECRNAPDDQTRAEKIAMDISTSLMASHCITIDPSTILTGLVTPWFTLMENRSKLKYEIDLDSLLHTFLTSSTLSPNQSIAETLIDSLGCSFLQWDVVRSDAQPLFQRLHSAGKRIGIIANTVVPDRFYLQGYSDAQLSLYISSYTMSYSCGCRKPDPRIYRIACEKLDIDPKRSAFIGDKLSVDISCANAAGATSIWYNLMDSQVITGASPHMVIKSFSDFADRIQF
jgi:HAD superfamily hydrolase (TIGR01662 family)